MSITMLYRAIIIVQIVTGSNANTAFQSIEPQLQQQIDNFVSNVYLPSSQVSTLGLGIVKNNGEILYTTGFGMANKEKKISNGNKTQFLMGSSTKSFTATLVVKVLSEKFLELGETVLDAPIIQLMPSVDFVFSDRFRTDHATFRDLLAHRMCFFRDDLQFLAEAFSTTEEIVYVGYWNLSRQRYAKSICEFRSEFEYNSQMFVIAGELIRILTNKSYTELMTGFLNEIGMVNSAFVTKSDNFSAMPFRSVPYYLMNNVSHPGNPELIKRLTVIKAAGGLYVPPDDMIQYMKLHLNKGKVNGKQVIREDVMEWITKPSNTLPITTMFKTTENPNVVTTFGYGLGMMLAVYEGWEYNHHGGHSPPYRTLVSFFPGHNLGIFTSSNEGPVLADPTALHIFIFELLLGSRNAIGISRNLLTYMKTEKKRKTERISSEFLDKIRKNNENGQFIPNPWGIIGKYGSGASGDVEILPKFNVETKKSSLYIRYGKWYRGWLENVEGSIYNLKFNTDVIQDYYAEGITENICYVIVNNDTLQIADLFDGEFYTFGSFKRGVSLPNLPIFPWNPDSC